MVVFLFRRGHEGQTCTLVHDFVPTLSAPLVSLPLSPRPYVFRFATMSIRMRIVFFFFFFILSLSAGQHGL